VGIKQAANVAGDFEGFFSLKTIPCFSIPASFSPKSFRISKMEVARVWLSGYFLGDGVFYGFLPYP